MTNIGNTSVISIELIYKKLNSSEKSIPLDDILSFAFPPLDSSEEEIK